MRALSGRDFSFPPNDMIAVIIIIGRGDLQLNMGFGPQCRPGMLHVYRMLTS